MCKKLLLSTPTGELRIIHIGERTVKFFDAFSNINPRTFDGNWNNKNVKVHETDRKEGIHEFEILKIISINIIDPKKCIATDNISSRPGTKEYIPKRSYTSQGNILERKKAVSKFIEDCKTGFTITELAEMYEVSDATISTWKKKYLTGIDIII